MNPLTKIAVATVSVGTASGIGVVSYLHLSKGEDFATKLGESVLNLTGTQNETTWAKRFKDLTNPSVELDEELIAIKAKAWTDLQKWCNNNKENKFTDKDDKKYQKFEAYCTWKIGDKLTGQIADTLEKTNEKWKTAHTKLKTKKREDLSPELQKVFDTTTTGRDNKDKGAMHKWCTDSYKKTWTGDNDANLKEVSEHCKE